MKELLNAIVLANVSSAPAARRGTYSPRPVVRNSKFGNVVHTR